MCGDFKVTINQCVEAKLYPLPTTENIFAHLAGGRVFSKLDLSQAYLQLPVDEDCKDLLVINTPKGLFTVGTIDYHMGYLNIPICNGSYSSQVASGLLS